MDISESNATSIWIPCHRSSRLDFYWGPGTELRLGEIKRPGHSTGIGSSDVGDGAVAGPHVVSVPWSAPTAQHISLAQATVPLRAEMQQQEAGTGTARADGKPAIAAFCMAVRQLLFAQHLQAIEAGAAPDTVDMLAFEACAWGLLELFYVLAPATEGYFAEDLAAWLAEAGDLLDAFAGVAPTLGQRVAQLLDSTRPDASDDYWPCLAHLVAVGRLKDAMALLMAHDALANQGVLAAADLNVAGGGSAASQQRQLLDILYVLLRQTPQFRRTYTPVSEASPAEGAGAAQGKAGPTGREFDNMAEFLAYKSKFQAHCRQLPDQAADLIQACNLSSPRTVQGVLGVVEVLGGSAAAASRPATHWAEFAVVQLMHVRPQLQAAPHLRMLASAAASERPPGHPQGNLAMLLDLVMAIAEAEVQGVVEVLTRSPVSAWFMASAYDLLQRGGSAAAAGVGGRSAAPAASLQAALPLMGGDQAEYWRLFFTETLLGTLVPTAPLTAWPQALQYLALCPTHGADAAEVLLESLPASAHDGDTRVLRQALASAAHYGLPGSETSLCRSAAAAAWYQGRIGVAASFLGAPGGARDTRRLSVLLQPLLARAAQELVYAGVAGVLGDGGAAARLADNGSEAAARVLAPSTSASLEQEQMEEEDMAAVLRAAGAPAKVLAGTATGGSTGPNTGTAGTTSVGTAGGAVLLLASLHQLLVSGRQLRRYIRGQPLVLRGQGQGALGSTAAAAAGPLRGGLGASQRASQPAGGVQQQQEQEEQAVWAAADALVAALRILFSIPAAAAQQQQSGSQGHTTGLTAAGVRGGSLGAPPRLGGGAAAAGSTGAAAGVSSPGLPGVSRPALLPRCLILPVLASCVPLLESVPAVSAVLTLNDVHALMAALNTAIGSGSPSNSTNQATDPVAAQLLGESPEQQQVYVDLCGSQQAQKSVRLALARALARVHVQQTSAAAAAAAANPGSAVVGVLA